MKIVITGAAVLLALCNATVHAQTNAERAYAKGMEAIQLMDKGEVGRSLELLEEARKLDPKNVHYPYEIAYAHCLNEDYSKSAKILEGLKKHKDANDRVHQLLGNSYSLSGDREKAIKAYEEGLKKFPDSGILHLERGNMEFFIEEYEKALSYYENGIKVDPRFPSNYYWAARLYCSSTEEIWGMLYGEIFMNLERNSKRTAEISKLLYDTYRSEIQQTSDTSMSVSFCKQMVIIVDQLTDMENMKLPFCMVYETTLLVPVAFTSELDLTGLHGIRQGFIEQYYSMGHDKTHPNVLFDYQKRILDEGHMEAYDHWLLMMGDEDAFTKWQSANEDKWGAFVAWYSNEPLQLDENRKFHRTQY
jgi:tetratricopeptide (TPR) repeat protein